MNNQKSFLTSLTLGNPSPTMYTRVNISTLVTGFLYMYSSVLHLECLWDVMQSYKVLI